ncbi:hypothetical protein LOZ53_004566 [Ophidiomyces ophidiicola]|nr:hypothetical protein LOZ55_002922 [Ophidiomyces ophidiicola]KAI1986844.1 hypothetical protein LOZ53_004566 [Ophidiomyces ophidiicola]KAI1988488.1 hypothetical protein LOZ54_003170 [Ophidiomyces ophidiicola]KAI1991042.1 hypothetical protein LOZ51_004572 [Ophidiomyces ophidiicola]
MPSDVPLSQWINLDLEALALSVFTGVMFIAVSVHSTAVVCSCTYRGLVAILRAFAVAARVVSSEYSSNGMKGVVKRALNMAQEPFRRTRCYRFLCRLILGDVVAIVAVPVILLVLYLTKVNYGDPAWYYITGVVDGIVSPVDAVSSYCTHTETMSLRQRFRENPNLRLFCEGEGDGYRILMWWTSTKLETTLDWELLEPILVYCVSLLFGLFILAVFFFNHERRSEKGTQTDSTVDLNGDSKGLSEKATELLSKITQLEAYKEAAGSTVDQLKGDIRLKDRKVQKQSIELECLRKANDTLLAANKEHVSQCQTCAEKLSRVEEDTTLDQVREELRYAQGLKTLLMYGYNSLKQLAGTFAELSLGEQLLFFTSEIEKKCEAVITSGVQSWDEVRDTLGTELVSVLKEASECAAEIRLQAPDREHLAKQHVELLNQKLNKCRRQMRLIKAEFESRQIRDKSADKNHSIEVDSMRREHAIHVKDLEAKIADLEQAGEAQATRAATQVKDLEVNIADLVRAGEAGEAQAANAAIQVNDLEAKIADLVRAGMAGETEAANDKQRMSEELESYKNEILSMRQKLSSAEEKFAALERELSEARSLNNTVDIQRTINQGLSIVVSQKDAALQQLNQELANAIEREDALKKEIVQKAALPESQVIEPTQPTKEAIHMGELESQLVAVNQYCSEMGQKQGRLLDELADKSRELAAEKSKMRQVQIENDKFFGIRKSVEAEMRELCKQHEKERKEIGNAKANAVGKLQVQLIEQGHAIDDLQRKLKEAQDTISSSMDMGAVQRIQELEVAAEKLKVQGQKHTDIELALRKENQDLKQRLEQVGREQSTKTAVGSVFAEPKGRIQKLQRDVQAARRDLEIMEEMRDRLAEEIREFKLFYGPINESREPRTPLTVQGMQLVLQNEREIMRM